MADFFQNGVITTIHAFESATREMHEQMLHKACKRRPIGLLLPVTADDMRAETFRRIVNELQGATYIDTIVVVLGRAPSVDDYRETLEIVRPLGEQAHVLWTNGERVESLKAELASAGLHLGEQGKGMSVWTAFGFLLADPRLRAYVLHDCDIANYDRDMLARLCLPMVHPSFDFEFCKAYYARYTTKLYGRVARLLVTPLIRALLTCNGPSPFLAFLDSFRYPLSGEFAVTPMLARYNRIPGDWGLEVGTLAEVFRNTSIKRVCQVDLCPSYEHKHQTMSVDEPNAGLMKMGTDIVLTLFRTLASMGTAFDTSALVTLRSSYMRTAQDSIRQYQADAVMNGLEYDRHSEELAVEAFGQIIADSGDTFLSERSGGPLIPNWNRVLAIDPEIPQRLRQAVADDLHEFG